MCHHVMEINSSRESTSSHHGKIECLHAWESPSLRGKQTKQPRNESKLSRCVWRQPLNRAPYVAQMHGRTHPHQRRRKGHNAPHKTDLRQPKRARICATGRGSPHQTSVPVSCCHSPQLRFSRDCVYCLREYARILSARRVEPTQNATKKNNNNNTHQRRNPRRSRHAAYDKRLCQFLSISTVSVSKGHPTGLDCAHFRVNLRTNSLVIHT